MIEAHVNFQTLVAKLSAMAANEDISVWEQDLKPLLKEIGDSAEILKYDWRRDRFGAPAVFYAPGEPSRPHEEAEQETIPVTETVITKEEKVETEEIDGEKEETEETEETEDKKESAKPKKSGKSKASE